MNIIVFCIRILLGSISLGMAIWAFSTRETLSAWATLILTLVVVWPVIYLLYLRQKPLPADMLINDFGVQRSMAWIRFSFGFIIALACADKLTIQDTGKISCIIMGLFLISPLSAKVLTYRLPWATNKKNPFSGQIIGLIFLRSYGILSMLVALDPVKDPEYPGAKYWYLFSGIALVFIRQLSLLLTGKRGTVPLWATVQSPAPKDGPSAQFVPVDQSIQLPAVKMPSAADLQKLSTDYSNLFPLEPAQKGAAYKQFLSNLFALYDFSVVSNFQLQGNDIAGSFEMEGQTYILAARYRVEKSTQDDLLVFNGKVEAKSTWARGIFISNAGFTQEGLETFSRGKRTSIICMDGNDLRLILEGRLSLPEAIKRKARRAVETNHSFVPLQKLL